MTIPRTPAGVLELLPSQQIAFQRMLDTIRLGFERFGFLPIETPTFELTDVLLAKSGGEPENQVYFVQSTSGLAARPSDRLPDLAMRFDLTVPLARYVAEHEADLNFPFRSYQIQRVYRGERAQKGRYREFYQCDIDVIGKDTLSLAYDAEIPAVIHGIFQALAIGPFKIHLNHRKILRGLLESMAFAEADHAIVLHEIDRLGKQSGVEIGHRLVARLSKDSDSNGQRHKIKIRIAELLTLLTRCIGRDARYVFSWLRGTYMPSSGLLEGIAELEQVHAGILALGVPVDALQINLSIARGLDYYTGMIYETFLDDHPELGSICSGGRYENLAGHYTRSKLPGVGISIGATRLFSQLIDQNMIRMPRASVAHVLVLAVDPTLASECARMATNLRNAGVNVEVYGGAHAVFGGVQDKLGKQLKYADHAQIPLVLLYGANEKAAGVVQIRDLRPSARTKRHDVPTGDGLVGRVCDLLGLGRDA